MDKNKKYNALEVAEELKKSLYKMVKKALNKNNPKKEDAQKVVEDVLDPNYVAEVPGKDIPKAKDGVVWKSRDKGVDKLKKFKKGAVKKSKGVHLPIEDGSGQSKAGKSSRKLTEAKRRDVPKEDFWGRAKRIVEHGHGKEDAVSEHRKVIREQGKMGKPDLPKSEKLRNKIKQ